jgi:acyl-CoA synthetase (AMP-forming)/AMP-acid ligase II
MDFLLERFATAKNKTAFITDGDKVTYGDLLDKVAAFDAQIRKWNVKSGDVVLLLGDYSPDLFCLMLSFWKNKNTLVPLTRESVVERDTVLEISTPQWSVEFSKEPEKITCEKLTLQVQNTLLSDFLATGEPGMILFSSGSTGKPKGILHNMTRVTEKFKVARAPTVAITFLMMDHFGGINTLLAITSSLGTVVTVKNRSVKSISETIQNYKVELLPTTPSFLNMLVRTGSQDEYDFSSLKLISYGTEVMPQITLDRLKTIFPQAKLQQTYGLSELGVLRSKSRDDGSLWVKIGGEGFQTKVVDDILWVKSDYAMVGYLNAESPFDSEGWFNTQDKVEVDGDYFRILGRVTDLINIGGQKVYPSEIEEVILKLPNIEDVSVYSEKNGFLGNIIVAKIVTKEPEPLEVLKPRIRKACLEHLTNYKVPSKILIAEKGIYSNRHKKVRRADP